MFKSQQEEDEHRQINLNYLKAARAGDAEQVAHWLDKGAELYICNTRNGWSAMNYALACNHPAVVRILVGHGFDPNIRAESDVHEPYLCWALKSKKREAIDEFVRCGADINLKNKGNKPPLVFCLEENDTFGISYLMNAGANPDPALAYLNHTSDIKWFGDPPTAETVRHFHAEVDAWRKREGAACEDAMERGSTAAVAPLKPLQFRLNRKAGFQSGMRL